MLSDTKIRRDMKVGFPRRVLLGVRKLASPKYRALRNKEIIDKFINTPFSNIDRYINRIEKIKEIENE